MKITRISYLFAFCPAMLADLTSCNKGPLPGKALTYDEAYAHVLKTAPEYNYRTNLSKGATLNLSIDEFTIDGKVTLPGGEPTNIRFTMPKQDNFDLYLNNENGVKGSLQVREMLSKDQRVPNKALNASYNAAGGGGEFGGNGLLNMIFNPFLTTYTLSYAHTLVSIVSDLNIISENYSLDGDKFYVSYSIPDLKTFTQMAEEYELRALTKVFTIFRGTDGSVSFVLGFDQYGYISTVELKVNSNDIGMNLNSQYETENFRGLAKVNLKAKINQTLYKDDAYRNYSVIDRLGNAQFTTRKATVAEYSSIGFSSRNLDARFVEPALDYYDVVLPTYGTDFIIEHPGKTSSLDNIKVTVGGIDYPAKYFMNKSSSDILLSYDWFAKNSTIGSFNVTSGRTLFDQEKMGDQRMYYPNKNYTFTYNSFDGGSNTSVASLFADMLEIQTVNGHKHNPINYMNDGNATIKNHFYMYNESSLFAEGENFQLYNIPFLQDFSTTLTALPYGFVHFNFTNLDSGINYNGFGSRSNYATIDGKSSGVLDIYNNLQADGSYLSPVIAPTEQFEFNPNYVKGGSEEEIKDNFIRGLKENEFFYSRTGDKDRLYESLDFIPVGSWNELKGFQFTLKKEFIDYSKEYSQYMTDNHEAVFGLPDFSSRDDSDNFFIRKNVIEPKKNDDVNRYLDYSMIGMPGGKVEDCVIFNPSNGLEEGSSKVTFEEVEVEGAKIPIAKFEDIKIRVDEGYLFPESVEQYFYEPQSYVYHLFENKGRYDWNSSIDIFKRFAKLSPDRKEILISTNNLPDGKEKFELLGIIRSFYQDENSNYFKLIFPSFVDYASKKDMNMINAGEEESNKFLNFVAGANYTYVQVLPRYTSEIDKDLQIVMDF